MGQKLTVDAGFVAVAITHNNRQEKTSKIDAIKQIQCTLPQSLV